MAKVMDTRGVLSVARAAACDQYVSVGWNSRPTGAVAVPPAHDGIPLRWPNRRGDSVPGRVRSEGNGADVAWRVISPEREICPPGGGQFAQPPDYTANRKWTM